MPCVRVHPHRFHHGLRHHPFFMMGHHPHFGAVFHEDASHEPPLRANKARIHETETAFTVRMDVPGVKAHQVTIEEKDGEVEIVAIRMNGMQQHVLQTYQDVLYMDPLKVDTAKAEAHLNQGVLQVNFPKKITPESVTIQAVGAHPPVAETTPAADEFRFMADIPGIKPSQLKIEVRHNDVLTIHGERTIGDNTMVTRRVTEIPRGTDMTQARAFLVDGVFTLLAPKHEISSTPLRFIAVNDVPSMEDLHIDSGDRDDDDGNKKQGDQVMVETVEEKEWEHIDDSKPSAKN